MHENMVSHMGKVEFLFCDPPYNCLALERDKFSLDKLKEVAQAAGTFLTDDGTCFFFCAYQQVRLWEDALKDAGLVVDTYPQLFVYNQKCAQGRRNNGIVVSV
jgi:hypothetical protein